MSKRDRKAPDRQDVEIGRRLRIARESRRRTQIEMATLLGIAETTYGRREAGEIRVRWPEIVTIARFLEVEPEAFLPSNPPPTAPPPRPPLTVLRELEAAIASLSPDDPELVEMLNRINQLPPERSQHLKAWLAEQLDRAERPVAGQGS
jgi:transcriptional regulator with XRE-family HTH domain